MNSLTRIYNLAAALRGTEFERIARELAEIARVRAHSHPRGNLTNIGRKLRRMAIAAGVWQPGLGVEA